MESGSRSSVRPPGAPAILRAALGLACLFPALFAPSPVSAIPPEPSFPAAVKLAPGVRASGNRLWLTDPNLRIVRLAPSRAGVQRRDGDVFLEIICFCPAGGDGCRASIAQDADSVRCEPTREDPCAANCKLDTRTAAPREPWRRKLSR